jgi:hypothetical protein
VAPNMANMCCKPRMSILGFPRTLASLMGAEPMVDVFAFMVFSSLLDALGFPASLSSPGKPQKKYRQNSR